MDRAPAVAENDVRCTEALQEFGDGGASSAGSAYGNAHVCKVLSHHLEGVDQRRQRYYGRAVLVVVKDRYLQDLLQPLFYLEAAWCADVLQVDPSKDGLNPNNGVHDDRWILGGDGYGKCINACKILEQNGLSLHNRDGGQGPNVAQTQNGSSVRHHGHQITLGGVLVNVIRVLLDLATGFGHARSVCQAQIEL